MRQANQQHGSEPALSIRPWQRYGKVVRAEGEGGERLARIHMISTSDADAERLEALLR